MADLKKSRLAGRRLVLCLDGTWNNRDDTTNVFHHFVLTLKVAAPTTQIAYYHEGVGTGVLDGISGGAFGFGLEANVRAGYNWLVENFQDESDSYEADAIYIFGFSRGAYTARSLVGFITTCGLLRRGAPLSVNQLWGDYCILGREREHRISFWDKIFGAAPTLTRRITDLICDPWNVKRVEQQRAIARQSSPQDSGLFGDDWVPGQLTALRNTRERLLVRWSRRVKIQYLGIYDTVGAMGIDALAIPGLRSKLAMQHNMRPTTLVQYCRHALAVDEHRLSFRHTPFIQYIGHATDDEDNQKSAMKDTDAETHWKSVAKTWKRKIEQRWFVGAHSNVGGGYPDNELAQIPLQWLLKGAREKLLEVEDVPTGGPTKQIPKDSFAEFAKPFWTQIFRAKRFYRTINPPQEIKADPEENKKNEIKKAGFSLKSINETIDDSVFAQFTNDPTYRPPNLIEYAQRKISETLSPDDPPALQLVASARGDAKHRWLEPNLTGYINAVLWASLAAIGLIAVKDTLLAQVQTRVPFWVICITAMAILLVDWGESRAGFSLALGPHTARWNAFLSAIYWLRVLGFVLFLLGTVATLAYLFLAGWYSLSVSDAGNRTLEIINGWWALPASASVTVVLISLCERSPGTRLKFALSTVILGIIVGALIAAFALLGGHLFALILSPVLSFSDRPASQVTTGVQFAGFLLLLQITCICFLNAFNWVGEPMSQAHLGSIVTLQRHFTPGGVSSCLERWRKMLACRWSSGDDGPYQGPAAEAMREAVRGSLWRDIFGFIPAYTVFFALALRFAADWLQWLWLKGNVLGVRLWLLLPLTAALADYCEDFCHLRYIVLHAQGKVPKLILSLFAGLMTLVKFIAFFTAAILTLGAILVGTWIVFSAPKGTGWQGAVILLVSSFVVFGVCFIAISAFAYRLRTKRKDAL